MLAVRAPFELLVSIGVGVVDTLQKALLLLAVNASDYEFGAVTKEGDPFAVRRNMRCIYRPARPEAGNRSGRLR